MKPKELLVRCYAIQRNGYWSAVCIDLSLVARGATYEEVQRKMDEQIDEYVTEALTVDRDHAAYLLNRTAPFSQHLVWYWLGLLRRLHTLRMVGARVFSTSLPMVPAHNAC
ncbi:hypothetical protein RBI14_17190 [Alcaligenaceae bacterium B3P038]|nr:hypothetical protein [Alcaligenaceae bacterium B3P038]